MKLIVCHRDLDHTKVKGDLISWHNENDFLGKQEGIVNAVELGGKSLDYYVNNSPFIILNLPLVTLRDIQPVINDKKFEYPNKGYLNSPRKWKINFEILELRTEGSTYSVDDISETKDKYLSIEDGLVRRDTLTAYKEITRDDITIADIKVLR